MKQRSQISKFRRQQIYVKLLSKPRKPREKWAPNKKFSTGVRKSALKAKCTSLVKVLAQPLPRRFRTIDEMRMIQPKVAPAALKAKPRPWDIQSALPKLKVLRRTKNLFFRRLGRRQKRALMKTFNKVLTAYNENHPSEGLQNDTILLGQIVHKKCCKESIIDRGKKICELNKRDRVLFRNRMLLMGRPKKRPPPPKIERGKKKPLKEFRKRLKLLTRPRYKYTGPPPDPFEVKQSALTAICSEWVAILAKHREPRPPAPVYDFRGNEILPPRKWDIEARRRVIASERTKQLATPKSLKKKLNEDTKEDPFRVSKAALKATCSERLAQLARPIQR